MKLSKLLWIVRQRGKGQRSTLVLGPMPKGLSLFITLQRRRTGREAVLHRWKFGIENSFEGAA